MDHTSAVSEYTVKFLHQLGISDSVTVQVKYDKEADLYQILFHTDQPSLLIGYHGDNLSAIQSILGLHFHSQFDQWINLSVNVNDYRERRELTIHSLADTAVSRVLTTNHPHSLPPMSASERRMGHMYLQDHPRVLTSSQGVGKSRSVVVSPKS